MKKLYLILGFLVSFGFLVFADTGEQEEVDFLLFQPNSSNQFVNENQATVQLNNLANYLKNRNLVSGQIYVYGYAAAAANDIEPINLSRERALHVIDELQKRGITKDLFSDPIGYGSVDLWGNNTNEAEQSPNRRVRIVLDGDVLTPQTIKAADTQTVITSTENRVLPPENVSNVSKPKLSRIIVLALLLLALLALFLYYLFGKKKKQVEQTITKAPPTITPVVPTGKPATPVPPVVPIIPVVAPVIIEDKYMELDEEEIRRRAYELFQERNYQHGYNSEDWYRAECEIIAKYEAMGYKVIRKVPS